LAKNEVAPSNAEPYRYSQNTDV